MNVARVFTCYEAIAACAKNLARWRYRIFYSSIALGSVPQRGEGFFDVAFGQGLRGKNVAYYSGALDYTGCSSGHDAPCSPDSVEPAHAAARVAQQVEPQVELRGELLVRIARIGTDSENLRAECAKLREVVAKPARFLCAALVPSFG